MPANQQPSWLTGILNNKAPPPKLYAWTPSNLQHGPFDNQPHSQQGNNRNNGSSSGVDDLDRRIFILGVGNIGRLYASHLVRSSNGRLDSSSARVSPQPPPPITLVVHRRELLTQWQEGMGIELTRGDQVTREKQQFDIEWWTDSAPEHGPVREVACGGKLRNLFVSTKSSAGMPEVDRLRRYLDDGSTIAFAQNGMSKLWPPHGRAYVAARYEQGKEPSFLACVVNHGVLSTGPFKSVHAAPADGSIGPVLVTGGGVSAPSSATYLTEQISSVPELNTKSVSTGEIWLLQLEKLVMNSSINPLTALLRCKNGALFTDPDDPIGRVLDRLLQETSTVLHKLIDHEDSYTMLVSYARHTMPVETVDSSSSASVEIVRTQLLGKFSPTQLKNKLYSYGAKVGENRSSMLQDVEAGKKTEIRDFNGWLVDMAAFLDKTLDCSTHKALVDLVESGVILTPEQLGKRLL